MVHSVVYRYIHRISEPLGAGRELRSSGGRARGSVKAGTILVVGEGIAELDAHCSLVSSLQVTPDRTYHIPVALDTWEVRRVDEQGVDARERIEMVDEHGTVTVEIGRAAHATSRDEGLAVVLLGVEQLAGLHES